MIGLTSVSATRSDIDFSFPRGIAHLCAGGHWPGTGPRKRGAAAIALTSLNVHMISTSEAAAEAIGPAGTGGHADEAQRDRFAKCDDGAGSTDAFGFKLLRVIFAGDPERSISAPIYFQRTFGDANAVWRRTSHPVAPEIDFASRRGIASAQAVGAVRRLSLN